MFIKEDSIVLNDTDLSKLPLRNLNEFEKDGLISAMYRILFPSIIVSGLASIIGVAVCFYTYNRFSLNVFLISLAVTIALLSRLYFCIYRLKLGINAVNERCMSCSADLTFKYQSYNGMYPVEISEGDYKTRTWLSEAAYNELNTGDRLSFILFKDYEDDFLMAAVSKEIS